MNDSVLNHPVHPVGGPGNANMKTALVGGALAALLVSTVYLFVQVHDVRAEAAKARDSMQAEIENLKENSTVASATERTHVNSLKDELENARRQANLAASQAKREALTHAEQLASRLQQEQQQQQKQVSSQFSEVKEAATSTSAKLADVSGDVTNVKTQVASTKSELDRTVSDLKKVSGDLGITSGYVATNGKELAALKRLGERNYTEFHITKSKQPQRVGDISIQLKKADPKRNRFTLDVLADDKKTEKKDRTVNEPVQFYVAKARQPYELVVNEVKKDQIVGYLSAPKDHIARN
ncbi:MAG: hypothetical protein M3Z23_08075 [Acidobacteriota bacterium]|nr:hypothetical protein [Acidobacteriota bacterium]